MSNIALFYRMFHKRKYHYQYISQNILCHAHVCSRKIVKVTWFIINRVLRSVLMKWRWMLQYCVPSREADCTIFMMVSCMSRRTAREADTPSLNHPGEVLSIGYPLILLQNAISLWIIHVIVLKDLSVWRKVICIIYQTGFIIWLPDHLQKSKYWRRGRRMQYIFSLTILKENCLLLQLPIIFSHTFDNKCEEHACMVPLSVVFVATYLKFVSNHPFW